MKKTMLMLSVVLLSNAALAQKKEKEVKYEKLYYKEFIKETNDISITVDNAVSTDGEMKFKMKITNKTGDFIIYKPEESKFMVNGKEMKAKEKMLIIKPNSSDFRVINLKGADYNRVKSYSFVLDGVYLVSPNGKGLEAPEYKLPVSNNDFTAGSFKCTMKKIYKETDATDVKFGCAYNGQKIGFVDPSKAAVRMPDGKEYAAVKQGGGLFGGGGPIMLMKGEDDSFSVKWDRMQGGKSMDMQKVEMIILWRDSFTESTPVKTKPETLNFEFDEALTIAKEK